METEREQKSERMEDETIEPVSEPSGVLIYTLVFI